MKSAWFASCFLLFSLEALSLNFIDIDKKEVKLDIGSTLKIRRDSDEIISVKVKEISAIKPNSKILFCETKPKVFFWDDLKSTSNCLERSFKGSTVNNMQDRLTDDERRYYNLPTDKNWYAVCVHQEEVLELVVVVVGAQEELTIKARRQSDLIGTPFKLDNI